MDLACDADTWLWDGKRSENVSRLRCLQRPLAISARSNLRRWNGFLNVEPPGRKAGELQVQSSHPTTGLDCGGAKLSATYIEGMGWDGISLPTQTLR